MVGFIPRLEARWLAQTQGSYLKMAREKEKRELLLKEIIQKTVQELSQNSPAKLSFVSKCSESHYMSISETNTGQEDGMGLLFNQSAWKCGHLLLWHMRCILPTSYLNIFAAFLVIRRGNGGCIRIHLLDKQPITSTSTCSCYQRLTWWKSIQIERKLWCLLFICCLHSKLQGVSLGSLPSFCDIAHVRIVYAGDKLFLFGHMEKRKWTENYYLSLDKLIKPHNQSQSFEQHGCWNEN